MGSSKQFYNTSIQAFREWTTHEGKANFAELFAIHYLTCGAVKYADHTSKTNKLSLYLPMHVRNAHTKSLAAAAAAVAPAFCVSTSNHHIVVVVVVFISASLFVQHCLKQLFRVFVLGFNGLLEGKGDPKQPQLRNLMIVNDKIMMF